MSDVIYSYYYCCILLSNRKKKLKKRWKKNSFQYNYSGLEDQVMFQDKFPCPFPNSLVCKSGLQNLISFAIYLLFFYNPAHLFNHSTKNWAGKTMPQMINIFLKLKKHFRTKIVHFYVLIHVPVSLSKRSLSHSKILSLGLQN